MAPGEGGGGRRRTSSSTAPSWRSRACAPASSTSCEIQLIPVLLGEGRLLFAGLGAEHVELELTRVIEAPGVTHLRYRVAS